jgi:fatty acid desaturase
MRQGESMTENEPRGPEDDRREWRHHHRHDEKEEEKTEEKDSSRNEKNWDEKWRRDPINTAAWAAIFIWAGLVLLGETTKWGPNTFPTWWETWAIIMSGAGVILLLSALARLIMPEHRRPLIGNVILGIIFLGVGLGEMTTIGWGLIGAIALIIIGLVIVLGGIFRKRN